MIYLGFFVPFLNISGPKNLVGRGLLEFLVTKLNLMENEKH